MIRMPSIEELEGLSTEELRDRAFKLARHRLDFRFFWNLLEAVPAVEAAAGHRVEAESDILSFAQRVEDLVRPDTTEEADAFRPLYIEYLQKHEKAQD
jgi:hypothetical protein